MEFIVETEAELLNLEEKQDQDIFLQTIQGNDNYHQAINDDIGVYIYLLEDEQEYFINISHSEAIQLRRERVYETLNKFKVKYVLNKKDTFYYYREQGINDLSIKYELKNHNKLEESREHTTYTYFYNKYPTLEDINRIIPIGIHVERYRKVVERVRKLIREPSPPGYDFFNNKATEVFYKIEKNGINIKEKEFISVNKINTPEYNIKEGKVYTKYRLNNITSRPTNAFNSINFLAIPKKPEYRECIVPGNDVFLELDYDGYHLRILAEETGVEFDNSSIHTQLGRQYFKKEKLTEEDYKNSKKISFQKLYGIIKDKYNDIELFREVEKYKNNIYQNYKKDKEVTNRISGKKFTDKLEEMNPEKLLNYMVQSLETALNIEVLEKITELLENKQSNLILYTYDSIILDFKLEEGKELLIKIAELMENNKKYPIKWKQSSNLVL